MTPEEKIALAHVAKLKKGDADAWTEFADLCHAATKGEPDSKGLLGLLIHVTGTYPVPCCESCALGRECESAVVSGCPCQAARIGCCI